MRRLAVVCIWCVLGVDVLGVGAGSGGEWWVGAGAVSVSVSVSMCMYLLLWVSGVAPDRRENAEKAGKL